MTDLVGCVVWYDKSATDDRVWCVRRGASTVRARRVDLTGGVSTMFKAEGFSVLQPGGPRGVIVADSVKTFDEVPCG